MCAVAVKARIKVPTRFAFGKIMPPRLFRIATIVFTDTLSYATVIHCRATLFVLFAIIVVKSVFGNTPRHPKFILFFERNERRFEKRQITARPIHVVDHKRGIRRLTASQKARAVAVGHVAEPIDKIQYIFRIVCRLLCLSEH